MNDRQPTLWQVALSVLAAFFGVQSERNRERDFKHGRFSHFVIIGLIATLVFVLIIYGIVQLVVNLAGV